MEEDMLIREAQPPPPAPAPSQPPPQQPKHGQLGPHGPPRQPQVSVGNAVQATINGRRHGHGHGHRGNPPGVPGSGPGQVPVGSTGNVNAGVNVNTHPQVSLAGPVSGGGSVSALHPRHPQHPHSHVSVMVGQPDQGPPGPPSPGSPGLKVTPVTPDNLGPALARLGKSIALSVEMLATVGETIGDENPEIRGDMLPVCREARGVSNALEKLCESISRGITVNSLGGPGGGPGGNGPPNGPGQNMQQQQPMPKNVVGSNGTENDLETLLRTLRRLLVAATQILLLADNVVVKQLLAGGSSKEKQLQSSTSAELTSMNTMHHFSEFVKAFCDFGSEMVHLVRIATGKKELSFVIFT